MIVEKSTQHYILMSQNGKSVWSWFENALYFHGTLHSHFNTFLNKLVSVGNPYKRSESKNRTCLIQMVAIGFLEIQKYLDNI